jgi:MYXO-CTERM domain-containing protein
MSHAFTSHRRTFTGWIAAAMAWVAIGMTPASAVEVTIDSATMNLGYMNVFNLPADGGGFQFGSSWGVPDLRANFSSATTVNFLPNSIDDPNPYWYLPSGGPGSTGNKIMEANLYAQETGSLGGQTVNFTGIVDSYTLASGYVFQAFIRDFAPDFSSVVESTVPLSTVGPFSLSLDTIADPARHVQWGLQMTGPNVWITDAPALGGVQVTAVPEPSTWALGLLAVAGLVAKATRRRQ